MDDKEVDSKITQALIHGTNEAVDQKDKVWQQIQKGIQNNDRSEVDMKGTEIKAEPNKRKPKVWAKVSMAAALVMVFLVGTEPGQAAVDKIKEMFQPEKIIVEELEGQKERSKVSLEENRTANYVLYYDQERYTMEKSDNVGKLVPKLQPGGDYPEVFMEISQVKDKTPAQLKPEIEQELNSKFSTVQNRGRVKEPIDSFLLVGVEGHKFNNAIVRYYLVDNKEGGTFIIKQQFFVEAEEGHGARFDNILKEFTILEE